MSKLLRLPLVLLIALAMALVWSAPASADPPTPEDCAATTPAPEGCPQPDPALMGGDAADDPVDDGDDGADDDGTGDSDAADDTGTGTDTDTGSREAVPAFRGASTGHAEETGGVGALADEDPLLATPAPICERIPTFPGCPEAPTTPSEPLTCDELAGLLDLPGCPESFTCDDLAELFDLTGCPEGGPTCEDLAELFSLEGCPDGPPGSCEDFAKLLGVDDCEQIPCLDTSQLPDEAKEGLAPLLEGLEQIGVKECPPPPVTGGDTGGGNRPPTTSGGQTVHYANCDDARSKGKAPVHMSDPGYHAALDSDHDGIGCEETAAYVAPVNTQSAGKLAYTGIDLELWLRAGAILLSSGTLLLLAGRRRA